MKPDERQHFLRKHGPLALFYRLVLEYALLVPCEVSRLEVTGVPSGETLRGALFGWDAPR